MMTTECKVECRSGEVPSANGNCSARGLAKVAAVMANRGSLGEVTLVTEPAWEVGSLVYCNVSILNFLPS